MTASSAPLDDLYPGFETHTIDTAEGVTLHVRTGGEGPPLLLVHGYPQSHVIWHRVAPTLARHFKLVIPDLRGYGDSSRPPSTPDHATYSKRAMAQDLVTLMARLGHARFDMLAHDRGARVGHRLGIDHPQALRRLMLLDIAPTLAMYEQTNDFFARAYWHWFFLIQPAPLPERLVEADPGAYLRDMMGRGAGGLQAFDPRAWAHYVRALSHPGAATSTCEDYRAAASIDLVHDRADREAGRRLAMPLKVLWGREGVVARCYQPLDEWRRVADDVCGSAVPGGHYIPEEAPEALLAEAMSFFTVPSE